MNAPSATTPPVKTPRAGETDPRYERVRWTIFSVTWLAYAGFYLVRKSFSVAKTELEKPEVAGWSLGDMAWVDGAYLTVYAMGQFAFGVLGDRFGARRVILIGMLSSIVVAVAMGASVSVLAFAIFFALQGLCQSSGWAPLAKNMGEFFSRRERGAVIGFWCTHYALGGYLGSILAAVAISLAYGWGYDATAAWRFAFWIPALVLTVVWVLFFLFQRNRPEDFGLPSIEVYHGEQPAESSPDNAIPAESEQTWETIVEVLRCRMVLLLAGVYFFLKPTRYLILFSAPLYVNHRLTAAGADANAMDGGAVSAMFDLAAPVGVLVGGLVSDYFFRSRRVPVCVITLLALSAFLVFFPHLPANRVAIGSGFFVIGFLLFIPDSLVSGTAAIDFGTKKGASTAAGFINGCGSVGAIVGGTMPGWVEYVVGKGNDIWEYVFMGLSISLVLAALLLIPQWNSVPPDSEAS